MATGTRVTFKRYASNPLSAKGTVINTAGGTTVYVRWDTGAIGLYSTKNLVEV